MRRLAVVVVAACSGNAFDPPIRQAPTAALRPTIALAPVTNGSLCVTSGAIVANGVVSSPTWRAVAPSSQGEAAELTFRLEGATGEQRALASGSLRQQLGLKLRAADSCNVIYVMWRPALSPALEVSIKRNPGAVEHEQCGNHGYTRVKPMETGPVPIVAAEEIHQLRAELVGDELRAWIDGALVWRGALPVTARELAGFAGLRSDNLAFELVELRTSRGPARTPLPTCAREHPVPAGER